MIRWPAIWKTVPGARRYAVSDRGAIRSSTTLLAYRINDEGYPKVKLLFDDGVRREVFVHRTVALAFELPRRPGQRYVLHGNRCRTDCSLSNLRWGTHQDNHEDKVAHGSVLRLPVKLTRRQVAAIRRSNKAARAVAERYGVALSHVRDIRSGRRWAA